MSRLSSILAVVAGAAAGAVVALAIAGGGGTTKTVTTVVKQSEPASSIPTSLNKGQGLTINQIYRRDSPGVVDIIVTSRHPPTDLVSGSRARARAPASCTTTRATSSPMSTSSRTPSR